MNWIKRIIKTLVIMQVVYLVLLNGALRLPQTQEWINEIRPEKFHISWSKAWTWYPFRVHVRGGFANGQSRNQQWQFSASDVSASISLLALINRRVWINDVTVTDIDYRQRSRLKPDRDYADILEFFPEIEGWAVSDADPGPLPERRPWHVSIDDIRVSGAHHVWINQLRGRLQAAIGADLKVRSRGGPFSLDAHSLDIQLETLYTNGDREILQYANLSGSMGFSEFVPRENKNIGMLKYLNLDLDTDIDMNSLDFVNLFLLKFDDVNVRGRGEVEGRLKFEQGEVMTSTDLTINASDLRVEVMALDIAGNGTVNLSVDEQADESLSIGFGFRDLNVGHNQEQTPLLVGEELTLTVSTDRRILPETQERADLRSIRTSIDSLAVPGLELMQRFIPEKWPFRLHGGSGTLQGFVNIAPTSLTIDLRVKSDDADMGIRQYRFDTDLDLALKLDNPAILTEGTQVTGSYLKLTNARLQKEGGASADPAALEVFIKDSVLSLFDDEQKQRNDSTTNLLQLLGNTKMEQVLGNSRGSVEFDANVSSLAWINVLLGDEHHTSVTGEGAVRGNLQLDSGLPAPGTDVTVLSTALTVNVLDYSARGDGRISLVVAEGGANPDWHVDIDLEQAELMRKHETSAIIQNVTMELKALIEDVSFDQSESPFVLQFRIPSANVSDVSVFNRYFPPGSPFAFQRGTADLTADIELRTEDATGWVRLDSQNLDARIGEQYIGADLLADIKLSGGTPAAMDFDISGSALVLDEVHILGEKQQFQGEDWSAKLDLVRGNTTWKAPLKLDIGATLLMSDSRPLVALFRNEGGPKWLSSMLTVDDIDGSVELSLTDERLVIPHAHAISSNIELGAKGIIAQPANNGVFYLRYRKLGAILKVTDGVRKIHIFDARKKYDEYSVRK